MISKFAMLVSMKVYIVVMELYELMNRNDHPSSNIIELFLSCLLRFTNLTHLILLSMFDPKCNYNNNITVNVIVKLCINITLNPRSSISKVNR